MINIYNTHLQEYFYAYGRHMKEAVLSSLPPAFNSLVKQFNSWDTRDMKALSSTV